MNINHRLWTILFPCFCSINLKLYRDKFKYYFQGRTFGSLIHNFLKLSGPLNNVYLPLYHTPDGRKYIKLLINYLYGYYVT